MSKPSAAEAVIMPDRSRIVNSFIYLKGNNFVTMALKLLYLKGKIYW